MKPAVDEPGKNTAMTTNRLEAFSDGVIAIIITISVLQMTAPAGAHLSDLRPVWPIFLSYVLSFVYLGIYWNNHHHMLAVTERVTGGILWANLDLLFWLSLVPFVTGWMGRNRFAPTPTALYGCVLLLAAIGYFVLQRTIMADQGKDGILAQAVGSDVKGKMSPPIYAVAIPLAFVSPWISLALYWLVAVIWLVPDRRIERVVAPKEGRVE
jgi:uncharacterized membrane protein